ncbi:CinA family protein [Streptomyces cacaoi]
MTEAVASRAATAVAMLGERGETLAAAESLTGGLVAAELTAAAGASRAFVGSVTAYATRLKRDLLGVDGELLDRRGAVDPEVARAMAAGVRVALDADWGVATTGVAGPEPQDGQPVGTVYVAVAGPCGEPVAERLFLGDGDARDERDERGGSAARRDRIRAESVQGVLRLLYKELQRECRGKDREQTGGNGCLQP